MEALMILVKMKGVVAYGRVIKVYDDRVNSQERRMGKMAGI